MVSFSGSALLVGLMGGGCITDDEAPTDAISGATDEEGPDEADEPAPPEIAPGAGSAAGGTRRLGPTYTETALSPHGGSGGSYTGHVTPTAIIYAVQVNSGYLVDSIRFAWYQPRRFDNLYQAGDAVGSTPAYGGGGGYPNGWWYCPAGKGVIGIAGNTGALVDRIGVICGDVVNPDPNSALNNPSPLWGGGGGGWFGEDKCSPGRIVSSFNTRSGLYLDNLQAICINAH